MPYPRALMIHILFVQVLNKVLKSLTFELKNPAETLNGELVLKQLVYVGTFNLGSIFVNISILVSKCSWIQIE